MNKYYINYEPKENVPDNHLTKIMFIRKGDILIWLVIAKHQFFINYGTKIKLYPMTRVIQIQTIPKEKIMKLYFLGGKEGSNSNIELPLGEDNFIDSLFEIYGIELKLLESSQGFSNSSEAFLNDYDLTEFVQNWEKKNLMSIQKKGGYILEVPKDTEIKRIEAPTPARALFRKLGSPDAYVGFGLRTVPLKKYISIKKGETGKLLYELVEKCAYSMRSWFI